jgi:hypothetical protein
MGIKVVAEERRVGEHSGEALAKVSKEGHARHDVRREIKEMKAIGVHDIIEKIGERGAKATGEIVNEKGVPIWASLSKIGGDSSPPRLHPPQGPEIVPEVDRINRRRKEGDLRPKRRHLALRHLPLPGVFGHSLALAGLGCHGG